MTTIINVGMADYKIAKKPDILTTGALGSCVGVCIYDVDANVGGLAHVMLPKSNANSRGDLKKYADKLVPLMFKDLICLGAKRPRLVAKIVGGAQMFSFPGKANVLRIGERNIEAVEEELKLLNIPLLEADVGGKVGRSIRFDVTSGLLHIKSINQGEKVI